MIASAEVSDVVHMVPMWRRRSTDPRPARSTQPGTAGRQRRTGRVTRRSCCRGPTVKPAPPRYHPGDVRRAARRPAGDVAPADDVRGRRPGDHRRHTGRLRHHRDRRGQGARRRGAGRVRHAGQSRPADPAVRHRADRDHRGDDRARAAAGRGAAGVSRVRPRCRAGRPQRALRHRVPQGGLREVRLPVAAAEGARHGRDRPPGAHPRRGAQPQAEHAGLVLRRPLRRATARSTTLGPPSTCCTRCSAGSAATGCSRSATRSSSPRRSPRRSAASAISPTACRTRRGCTCSGPSTTVRSTSACPRRSRPGSSPTSRRPRSAPGSPRC